MTTEKTTPTTEVETVTVEKSEFVMKEKLSHLSPIRQAQAEVVLNRVRSSETVALSPKFYEDSDLHFYLTKNEVDNAVNPNYSRRGVKEVVSVD